MLHSFSVEDKFEGFNATGVIDKLGLQIAIASLIKAATHRKA